MIYCEFNLSGNVRVYEVTDHLLLLRIALDAKAEALPIPETVEQAHDYIRADCYQLEMFERMEDAEAWAESYTGFRSAELRKQIARYQERKATYSAQIAA